MNTGQCVHVYTLQMALLHPAVIKACNWARHVQEDVSDDMVGLSSRMLANAQAMQGAVQAREQLLSQTELAQDASAINSDYAVKTSKNIKKRSVVTLWRSQASQTLFAASYFRCCKSVPLQDPLRLRYYYGHDASCHSTHEAALLHLSIRSHKVTKNRQMPKFSITAPTKLIVSA